MLIRPLLPGVWPLRVLSCGLFSCGVLLCGLMLVPARAAEKIAPQTVRQITPAVLLPQNASKEQRNAVRRMLADDIRTRRRAVNRRDVQTWRTIKTVSDWEQLRTPRLLALAKSLGSFPPRAGNLASVTTKTHRGEGFVIENIAFRSRPGLWVTANLYRPEPRRKSMPGILLVHSHHNPKEQGELQDMGMNWARAGCYVLVMDQLGHGERRQHPFRSAADYSQPFRVSRQDYYFRYNTGIQLHLLGDSLIGWMVYDIRRGVDLLLSQPNIDAKRIILLGSVAGGGDPCAVAAALDRRVTCAVPFNFGGPQPENIYPLPKDAELSFNYVGGGSWESTRNLRLSARDGFLPWVIVGSIAPRRLIYAHEFSWDKNRDPVWKRFQTLYRLYGKPENLTAVHGYGRVTLPSSKASHCNNIGEYHRRAGIYAAFEKWFGIPAPPKDYRNRLKRRELSAVQGVAAAKDISLTPLSKLTPKIAGERIATVKEMLRRKTLAERRQILQTLWSRILGDIEPPARTASSAPRFREKNGVLISRTVLKTERNIRVPVLLLQSPARHQKRPGTKRPIIVCVAQAGKEAFLQQRADVMAALLNAGCVVCLPDVRGTGETSPGRYRGRRSTATGLSSSELMLGGTLVGQRVKDLRTVLLWLREHNVGNSKRIAVWGDSFAKINPPDRNVAVPLGIDEEPAHSEPLGHLLALLTPLFEKDITVAVSHRGGLISFRSVLASPFVYLPHDVVVPGAIAAGDLPLLMREVTRSTALWVAEPVTGENKPAVNGRAAFDSVLTPRPSLVLKTTSDSSATVQWLLGQLLR